MKHISFLIKPASSTCMRCRYCFYADVAEHRETPNHCIMDAATYQAIVDRAFGLGDDTEVTFAFQGGEPTCAGLDFFRSFCAYVDEHRTRQTVHLAIQTNGYVIDDTWAAFLAQHNLLVGVSIDGYPEMHDWLRPDARGEGTMTRVLDAIAALRRAGADFNILTVLTDQLAHHPQKLYRFYKQHKFDFVQLIHTLRPIWPPSRALCDRTILLRGDGARFPATIERVPQQ